MTNNSSERLSLNYSEPQEKVRFKKSKILNEFELLIHHEIIKALRDLLEAKV